MNKKNTPSISWEILALLSVLLLMHGAYAAMDLIPVALGVSAVLFVTILYKLVTKSTAIQLNWIAIACFAVAGSYSLTLFNAASLEMSGLKVIEWMTYGLIFLWLPKLSSGTMRNSLLVFSSVFVLAHLLLLFGAFENGAGLLYLKEGLSIGGVRLNGWFQYANATGASSLPHAPNRIAEKIEPHTNKLLTLILCLLKSPKL